MTSHDDRLAAAIMHAATGQQIGNFVALLTEFYNDLDRLDRTPRSVMLAHMVMFRDLVIRCCPELLEDPILDEPCRPS